MTAVREIKEDDSYKKEIDIALSSGKTREQLLAKYMADKNFKILEYLIEEKKADYRAIILGQSVLHHAVLLNAEEIVLYLLRKPENDSRTYCSEHAENPKLTFLHTALTMSPFPSVGIIKSLFDSLKEDWDLPDEDGVHPLLILIKYLNNEFFTLLADFEKIYFIVNLIVHKLVAGKKSIIKEAPDLDVPFKLDDSFTQEIFKEIESSSKCVTLVMSVFKRHQVYVPSPPTPRISSDTYQVKASYITDDTPPRELEVTPLPTTCELKISRPTLCVYTEKKELPTASLLHDAVQNLPARSLQNIIAMLEPSIAYYATRAIDNKGRHLLDRIALRPHADDRQKVHQLLEPYLRYSELSHFRQPIDEDAVKVHYSTENKETQENLSIACQVINTIRAAIEECPTHPSNDQYSRDDAAKLHNRIEALRELRKAAYPVDYSEKSMEFQYQLSMLHKIANCHELAEIAIPILKTLATKKMIAGVFSLDKGDHLFVIVADGVDVGTESNLEHWRNAVVLDPYVGTATPLAETHFLYHKSSGGKNYVGPANFEVHRLLLESEIIKIESNILRTEATSLADEKVQPSPLPCLPSEAEDAFLKASTAFRYEELVALLRKSDREVDLFKNDATPDPERLKKNFLSVFALKRAFLEFPLHIADVKKETSEAHLKTLKLLWDTCRGKLTAKEQTALLQEKYKDNPEKLSLLANYAMLSTVNWKCRHPFFLSLSERKKLAIIPASPCEVTIERGLQFLTR